MMAPAASPPTTPAATPQPRQCACAEDGNAAASVTAAASATKVLFMGVLSSRLVRRDHPPNVVTRSLRADETRPAPAHEIAVAVTQRPASPVTAGAAGWIGGAVAFIDHIPRLRAVVAGSAVGDRAANNCAADDARSDTGTDATTVTTR